VNLLIMSPHTLLANPTMFTPQRLPRHTTNAERLAVQPSSTRELLDDLFQFGVVHWFGTSAWVERDGAEEVVGAEKEGDGECEVPECVAGGVCGLLESGEWEMRWERTVNEFGHPT
jgi:hypothetical protein